MAQERKEGPFEKLGETIGGAVGKAAGRAQDMAVNAVGTVFGSALEQLGAWWSSPDAQRAAGSFGEPVDRACRTHYESSARTAASTRAADYESVRPRYQFGHLAGQNPDYQSKPFDQVEADLERAWERVGRERYGDWSEVRDQVGFGYTYRAPGAPNPT